ncbi:hypothetical protein [Alkalicoccus halolimnae]|uniref:Uncharacterized protein n=1 Tax=Alkalicoccus halolimnae TaxID=1667239 RepID=A0A5C7FFT8_9BACI|nr:hypothetical protein [Alkalicoccus halolimnae]TXF86177.1 hypothetical protein FTX54_06075 [Alkalicoccus halolimnae]
MSISRIVMVTLAVIMLILYFTLNLPLYIMYFTIAILNLWSLIDMKKDDAFNPGKAYLIFMSILTSLFFVLGLLYLFTT